MDNSRTWTNVFARGGIFAAAVGFAMSMALPQESLAQTLQDELYHLVKTHPRIEEQRAILRRANEAITTSRSGYLPTVSLTGSAGGNIVSNPTTRGTNDDNELVRFNALGIEVRQNLYDGGLTPNAVDSARMARDSVTYALESTVQTVMLQGITSYLNVLRLNELIRVARARERTIREQLQLETERVERGAGIEVDVLQAKSRLQLAIEQRVDLEGQLRQAMSEYVLHFNREPDITQMRLEPSPSEVVPPTLEDAIFTAREENPLLAGRKFLARSARFTVEAQRSGYLPVFDLVGRVDHESNVGGTRGLSKDSAVLIEMSWEVFSGFRTDAAVTSAQESLIEQLSAADRTKREVERQVRQAWTKLKNTRDRKELLLNAVSIAQEVFTARQKLRDAGKETTLNVLDAENEVFQAEQNLIRADYDTRVAVYELAVAMGIMTPAMLGIDVQIIENPEEYLTGASEIEDPEPDPRVQEYRANIEAQTPTPLNRAQPPAPETPPADATPTVQETEQPAESNIESEAEEDTESVIEPPPTDGTTGSLDVPLPVAESGTVTPVAGDDLSTDSIAVAQDGAGTSLFSGEFAVPPQNVEPNLVDASPAPQPVVPEAASAPIEPVISEAAAVQPVAVQSTSVETNAPSLETRAGAGADLPLAGDEQASSGPSLLERVQNLFVTRDEGPVEAESPLAAPTASAPRADVPPAVEPVLPTPAVAEAAPATGQAVRPAVAKLEPVTVPETVRVDTDAIAVLPQGGDTGTGGFEIPGSLLFGDMPPPR